MFMVLKFVFNNTCTYKHINVDQDWQWREKLVNVTTIFLDHKSKTKYCKKDMTVSAGL